MIPLTLGNELRFIHEVIPVRQRIRKETEPKWVFSVLSSLVFKDSVEFASLQFPSNLYFNRRLFRSMRALVGDSFNLRK